MLEHLPYKIEPSLQSDSILQELGLDGAAYTIHWFQHIYELYYEHLPYKMEPSLPSDSILQELGLDGTAYTIHWFQPIYELYYRQGYGIHVDKEPATHVDFADSFAVYFSLPLHHPNNEGVAKLLLESEVTSLADDLEADLHDLHFHITQWPMVSSMTNARAYYNMKIAADVPRTLISRQAVRCSLMSAILSRADLDVQ